MNVALQVRPRTVAGPQKLSGLRHYFSLIALLRRRLAKIRGPATEKDGTCDTFWIVCLVKMVGDRLLCLRKVKNEVFALNPKWEMIG